MEASALPASAGLARARLGLGAPLLRLRSDDQLVSLFRAGNEDAFRVIHDRYRARMLAYARQMLSASPADAEDAVQEIFVRAYAGLRANRRDLALRAWLYRIAHNRCIDELRRPAALAVETVEEFGDASAGRAMLDPQARVEQRETLRRLIADVQRLPEQQRSALLMRELGGMPYADLAGALGVSVPAVKSLLVRARVGLVQASEARDTACVSIREELIGAHDRGVRASGRTRRHLRDCNECRQFRCEVQGVSRNLGLLLPALGPLAAIAKLAGVGGLGSGSAAAGTGSTTAAAASTAAASTAAASGGAAVSVGVSTGAIATTGAAAGATHVATIIAATAIAAGGAIGIGHAVSAAPAHSHRATPVASVAQVAPAAAPMAQPATRLAPAASTPTPDPGASTPAAPPPPQTTPTTAAHTVPGTSGGPPLVTKLTSSSPATAPGATTAGPGTTSSATTAGAPTSGPTGTGASTTTTAPAAADPPGTTPGVTTDPTSADPTSTTGTGTIADPTPGTTAVPLSGSGSATPPPTDTGAPGSTDPGPSEPGTSPPGTGNPGTATGIVPTVSSASTWTVARGRRARSRTWRYALRGVAATYTSMR